MSKEVTVWISNFEKDEETDRIKNVHLDYRLSDSYSFSFFINLFLIAVLFTLNVILFTDSNEKELLENDHKQRFIRAAQNNKLRESVVDKAISYMLHFFMISLIIYFGANNDINQNILMTFSIWISYIVHVIQLGRSTLIIFSFFKTNEVTKELAPLFL